MILNTQLRNMFCTSSIGCRDINIDGFSCGSVRVKFTLTMGPDSTATVDDINDIIDATPRGGSELHIGEGVIITPSQSRVTGKLVINIILPFAGSVKSEKN